MSKKAQQLPLADKICLVTGATRGIGKGIALQLGQAGATVYITGRTLRSKNGLGSLEETATEVCVSFLFYCLFSFTHFCIFSFFL